jgi:hypothetical protein
LIIDKTSLYPILLALPGPLLSGIVIYFILSGLLVPLRIVYPVSFVMSLLIFGLTIYYSKERKDEQLKNIGKEPSQNDNNDNKSSLPNIVFIGLYIILIIFTFSSKQNPEIFIHWEQMTAIQIIGLMAAIVITFFAPGYALISCLDRKCELGSLSRFLIAYLLSILVTGLVGYVSASLGLALSNISPIIGVINVFILSLFVCVKIFLGRNFLRPFYLSGNVNDFRKLVKQHASELLVFAGLFALVILSTYYLYNGTIIGDQWYHHGRTSMFLYGYFKDIAASGIDLEYPPFEHAFLATFFAQSGVPSVNANVSISILNIMPVFAFYYFFLKWLPGRKNVSLLACTLFMLSSGFGWVYVLNSELTNNVSSSVTALDALRLGAYKTYDVILPNTFIDVAHPDITTGLIIFGLPAGFVLLGLIKENVNNKLKYIILITAVSLLGYLVHDEFGLFIIVASILPIIFIPMGKDSIFIGNLVALSFVIGVTIFLPGVYYATTRGITSIPLVILFLIFVFSMYVLYRIRVANRMSRLNVITDTLKNVVKGRLRFIFSILIISVVCYLYLLSYVTWSIQTPAFSIYAHTNNFQVVPWYFYPLRFGVTGLLGLCLILSYMFKKFEKEVFVFGIIAIIAFITGPEYSEFRFNKYIMASLAGLASLMLYKILSTQKQSLRKPIINGLIIGLIITSSSLSILMYLGYSALGLKNPTISFDESLPERHFPSDSEISLMKFLQNNINPKKDDNVAMPENEILTLTGLSQKIQGFAGILPTKTHQSPFTLNEHTLEGLYSLLNYSDSRFILLPKQYINNNTGLSPSLKFVLENFDKAYQNDKNIVLSVPPLMPPSSTGDVALMSQPLFGSGSQSYNKNQSDYYYYSLSALALSKIKYDIFAEDDSSAFFKRNLVLSYDPPDANIYLNYAKRGGTVVVLNTDNSFRGSFSKLLCIIPQDDTDFDSIKTVDGQSLKVLGRAKNFELSCPSYKVKSSYFNNSHEVSPFIIEKGYGNGRIIFVNAYGYFNALSEHPGQFFLTIKNLINMIGLKAENQTQIVTLNGAPFPYFFGNVTFSGPVKISSSSMELPRNYDFSSENVLIRKQKDTGSSYHQPNLNQTNFDNVRIGSLRLYGYYNVLVNSTNLSYFPSPPLQYGYVSLPLPVGSTMTLNLFNGSRANFFIGKDSQPVEVNGTAKIVFNRINSLSVSNGSSLSVPAIMKKPEIEVNGETSFPELRSNNPDHPTRFSPPWTDFVLLPLKAKGEAIVKLDHTVLAVAVPSANSQTQYVTYFKWIKVDTNGNKPGPPQKYLLAIPWPQVLTSSANFKLIVTILIMAAVIAYFPLLSPKINKKSAPHGT